MSDTPETQNIPMLSITSEPLPMPPEMFTLIGEIVVLWSRVETSIDQDISWMTQWPVVANLIDPIAGRPRAFKKRLELWRRATRALFPKIAVYQSYADEFKRAAGIVSKVRNHVIHGTWSLQPDEHGNFTVFSIRPKANAAPAAIDFEQLEIGIGFLQALVNDIRNLDNYITSFIASKALHMGKGLLKADREPSPERHTRRSPPKRSKRQRPPHSSRR